MALLESLTRQMIILPDLIMNDIIRFLDDCETNGHDIIAIGDDAHLLQEPRFVASEARLLKCHYLKVMN